MTHVTVPYFLHLDARCQASARAPVAHGLESHHRDDQYHGRESYRRRGSA